MTRKLTMLDFDAVHRLAPWEGLIDALHDAHLHPRPENGRLLMTQPVPGEQPDALIVVPSWAPGKALGAKLVTSFPRNVARHGIPNVDAIYVLFDSETGQVQTVLDGQAIVYRKTSADSALGVRLLAPPDARSFLMVGAGALAPWMVQAVRAVRPGLREIRVWNRTTERAAELAASLASDCDLDVDVCTDLDRGVAEADIVISATMSSTPLIKGDLLKPGAHVGMVGSFTTGMREGDDALLRRAMIYVDDYSAIEKTDEFLDPIARGVIKSTDVQGDLFALCQRRCEMPGPDRVTMFKNAGAAHLDLFVARYILAQAGG